MSQLLLNRSAELPADGWYQLASIGEHPITAAQGDRQLRLVQVIDQTACAEMANRFTAARAADGSVALLVDYDHFSEDPERPSEAAGWIVALDNRADGLWAQIEWSDKGAEAVRGRRYRFLSPVWELRDCLQLGNGRVRPLRLDSAAITNVPNLQGLRPLANRAGGDPGATAGAAGGKESTVDYKTELLALLGLPAEATDEQIAAGCSAKKTELENACAMQEQAAQLENRAKAAEAKVAEHDRLALEAQVEADLEQHKAVIVNRDEVRKQLLANRVGTLSLLAAMKRPEGLDEPLRNRQDAKPPEPVLVLANADKARRRGELINKVQRDRNLPTFESAREAAMKIEPELFKD